MTVDLHRPQTRRESFRTLARLCMLAALGGGAALLLKRRGVAPTDAGRQTCTASGICRGCPSLAGCGVPQALALKSAVGRTPAAAREADR